MKRVVLWSALALLCLACAHVVAVELLGYDSYHFWGGVADSAWGGPFWRAAAGR